MPSNGARAIVRAALLSTAALLLVSLVSAQQIAPAAPAAPAAKDAWKTMTELNKVDFTGLSAAQKTTALEILRDTGCTCGCGMKIAECRVNDKNCPRSPGLAAQVIAGVKAGTSADEIRKSMATPKAAPPTRAKRPVLGEQVTIPTAGSPFKGPKDAKVTIVEFSDFQCPYCSRAIPWVDSILKAYPNDVKLVFKQYPLPFHKQAKMAAEAGLAAHQQGKFWELHDKMFANYRELSRDNVVAWAKELGLDEGKIAAALDAGTYSKAVDKDMADGQKVGVRGTPTFFLNGKLYGGGRDLASVKPVIDKEISGGSSSDGQPGD